MRSKASFKGHPIHPALIPFPLAFLYGALIFDALGTLARRPSWWATGGHLAVAGVIAALAAAVPGFVDYLFTVPPRSSGKTRATRHLLLMLAAVVLVAASIWLRPAFPMAPDALTLGLEGLGVVLVTIGGWMGGTLVTRNQISVDHRYAQAGRWTEASVGAASSDAVRVAAADELEVDQMKLVRVNGRRVVLARTEQGWVAFGDGCTHKGGSLADGVMICGTVQCPWHGSQFDVRTGAVKAGPAEDGIPVYEVNEAGGEIRLVMKEGKGT